MRRDLFAPSIARLLILIDSFSGGSRGLEGRTKLAKLDFLLRYPTYLIRALRIRSPDQDNSFVEGPSDSNLESPMVRYRYGPWDPAYFSLLGSLIGRGLVNPIPTAHGFSYKTTALGREVAEALADSDAWSDVAARCRLLRRHFDLSGSTLKRFIYEYFPEVSGASWGAEL